MPGEDWIGLLLVAAAVFGIMSWVAFEGLKTRLGSIPQQAAMLAQQIVSLHAENNAAEMNRARAEQDLEEISAEIDQTETSLREARQRLHETQHRLPTTVYVLDQIIQNSYQPWLVIVRYGATEDAKPGTIAAEWARGRRILVFAENAANVRRRIQVRYPPPQGYHSSEPQPFGGI
ncbi:MAG TPA: hypothetical protein VM689_12705 [Aliidongia sp.]|nr:hypothetical protein [Aliidongia sp.]